MSVSRSWLVMSALAAVLLFAGVAPASAAPVAWSSVDVVLHDEQQPLLLISGLLPEGTELPAEASLSAAAGAELVWLGEVLGGPVDQDPTLEPTVERIGDQDVYTFTVTKGPRVQLEVGAPDAVSAQGTDRTARVAWTPTQAVPVVNLIARVPTGSQVATTSEGATRQQGPPGYDYYIKTFEDVKPGEQLALAVTYTPPAGAAAPGLAPTVSTKQPTNSVVPVFLVIGLLAGGALLAVGIRRKMAAQVGAPVSSGPVSPATVTTGPDAASAAVEPGEDVRADDVVIPGEEPAGKKRVPVGLATALIAGALVIGAVVAVNVGTKPQVAGGKITTQIAQVDQCTSAVFPLTIPEGADIEDAAEQLFDALRTTPGVGLVTVYVDDPRIEVGFCESNNSEAAIRQALVPTGYVSATE